METMFIGVLYEKEGRELFTKYYPTNEIKKVDKVLQYIGYHTLFIELISKTMKDCDYTLDEIIDKFKHKKLCQIEYLDKEGEETTINKNLQKLFNLQNLKENYVLLLKKLSILPSIQINSDFLLRILINEKKAKLNFLSDRGWLIKESKNYKLHQIIKEYILENHTPKFEDIEKQVDFFNELIKNSRDFQTAVDVKDDLIYFESIVEV